MKFKKLMLVTFLLLAILTIGAVSASEDADALAVDEIGGGDLDIAESSVDDTTVSDEDDGEALLGDSEPSLDNDHIFMGMDNITYRDAYVCEISDAYSGGGNFLVSVYANESLVFDETFESDGMVHYILAKELNGTFNGFYNIKVIYTQSNGIKGYNEQLTYFDNIVGKSAPPSPGDFNVTIADELDLDADRDNVAIRWYVPATVLDGRIELDGDISGYGYIYESDADSYMEFKLKDLSLTKPGTYDIVVNYVDDDWNTLELARGTLNVTKTYSADDFIELYNKDISSADDYIFWVHELNGQRPEGKVSIFYNGNQAFARTYIGTRPAYVTGDDLVGYFEGECIFTVVYERDADGKQYSKNLTANFINPINNKAPTPEDFNVTFPVKELTLNDGSMVIMRYFVPDGIDDNSASLRLRYGPGTIDYLNIFLEKADINKTKEFTFEKLYIRDQGTLNLELSYYIGEDKILDIANSTLKVTKVYTADNFIEVYTKTISDPTDYVCNVFDSDAGLVGDVTVLANNTSVYSKKFTDASNTAVRINENNLTGDLKGSYNIKVVYKRAADGKEYSKQAYITFGSSEPVVPDTRPYPNLELDIADIKYGNDAIINITADSTFSGVVLVQIGEIKLNVTVKDGFGTDKVSNLSAKDKYYALATFTAKDSDAFKSDYAYKYFSVEKAWSSVYLDGYEFDLDYGDSLKVNVTNLKGATGFIAKLDGENATVEGNAIIISGLTSGTHYLEVYTIPEDNYKEDIMEVVIRVANPKPKIIIDENIVLIKGSSINVNVTTIGAKGITAKIDGNDADVNGYVIEIPDSLSVGNHTLTVTTIPDTGFEAVTQTATITVKKFQSAVSVQNDNLVFDYNKSASTEVSFENATGVTAEVVDHSEANVTVKDNLITVSGLKPGSYELKVTTIVDEAYDSVTVTANITVNKLQSIVSIRDNLVFDYNQSGTMDVSYDADNVTAVVVGQPDANVTVNGYKVTVSGLNAGEYVLVITPDVDAEIYDITGGSVNVTVNKLQTGISIKDDVVFDYKGNASTTVLSDVKFVAEIVGQPNAVVVNGNVVTVSGLKPGSYTLKVTIDDVNYEPAFATANVTVNKIAAGISIDNIAYTYGSSGSAVVSTDAGAVIAEVIGQPKANVVVNGKKITVSGLAAGDYVLNVTTNDANYEVSSATANITVKKAATSIAPLAKVTTTYYSSGQLIVCLKDANGNPIQGKYVTVVLGKYSWSDWTNAKGRIYITTPKKLTAGKYYPTLTFNGDENYTGSTGTAKLVVNLATPKLTYKTKVTYKRSDKKKKYTIALKTDLGAKMKNTKVVIKVNKVNYKGYTNSKGQFTFKLTKLTKKGKYTAYVKYGGEKNKYNALNKKVIIIVK